MTAKAKINLKEGFIELEGTEEFVSKYLDQFNESLKLLKESALLLPAAKGSIAPLLTEEGQGENKSTSKKTRRKQNVAEKRNGPKTWVEELIAEDFFSSPRTVAHVLEALEARGHHLKASDLTLSFTKFVGPEKKLRRKKQLDGKRQIWYYTNW